MFLRGCRKGAFKAKLLKVHDKGAGYADVTEGSGGIWERLRYDRVPCARGGVLRLGGRVFNLRQFPDRRVERERRDERLGWAGNRLIL
jgi:hypothetical protein